MTNEKFIVIARGDREREEDPPAPYELCTRTVFETRLRAEDYARGISSAREPIVVSGLFSQLRFDDVTRFGDSLAQGRTSTST
jgi:hypothetical protein